MMPAPFETRVPKEEFTTEDTFNRARGLDLHVVASICRRAGRDEPSPTDTVRSGFCDEDGNLVRGPGWGTHFGWTLTSKTETNSMADFMEREGLGPEDMENDL